MSGNRTVNLVIDAIQNGSRISETARPLWRWFVDLHKARTFHAHGPNPIGYLEIEAYGRLMAVPFHPNHVAAIRAVDDAWIENAYQKKSPPPMTAEAFDAAFS